MLPVKQHESRVVYVAGSAREFPDAVQEWLSQADHRAIASANVYDALARLTGRRRPVALIVSIESVDWEELDFFDLAARLSRETSIYVTGHEHNQAKIEAALNRGARPFNAEELDQDLARPAPSLHPPTTHDLLAGTLPKMPGWPSSPSPSGIEAGLDSREPTTATPPRPTRSPVSKPTLAERPSPERGPQEPPSEERVTPPPSVRLVTPSEGEPNLEQTAKHEPPIPFPWAPSPNRPKRTPPIATGKSAAAKDVQTPRFGRGTEATGLPSEPSVSHPAPPSVELTAEELAALMGKPVPPKSASGQEQRS